MKKLLGYLKSYTVISNLIVLLIAISFYTLLMNFDAFLAFISGVWRLFSPLVTGALIAYLISPVSRFFEKRVFRGMKRRSIAHMLSVFLSFFIALSASVLLIIAIVPQLVDSVLLFFQNLDGYFESLKLLIARFESNVSFISIDADSLIRRWNDTLSGAGKYISENISGILGASQRVGSGLVTFFISLVLSVYILLDCARLARGTKRYLRSVMKEKTFSRFCEIISRSDGIFMRYLGSNVIDSLIVGTATFAFMLITDMPYPLLISAIIALTNFVPTFGPILGAVPALLIILLAKPESAVWYLLWTLVMEILDAYLIKPLLFGDSTGLRPLWVLAAIVMGGRLFGMTGMLLGIPVFAILAGIVEERIASRLKRKGLDANGIPKKEDSP